MKKIREFFKSIAEVFPGFDFILRMVDFIKSPQMLDGEWEASPLKLAGKNFVSSFFVISILTTGINLLFSNGDVFPFSSIVNPIYMSFVVSIDAIIFACIFWLLLAVVTSFKSKGFHAPYFLQVLQTYSVVNFLIVFMMGISINVSITHKILGQESSLITQIAAGVLAVLSFSASAWLLLAPTAKYLQTYYSKFVSWMLVIAVGYTAMSVNQNASFSFSHDFIIDKPKFCEYLFQIQSKENSDMLVNKSCIIGNCISGRQ